MTRDEVIAVLRQHESTLRARGVAHAALFGSVARGDARPDSDIDIMIELEPGAPIGIFQYAGLKRFISALFQGPVDVVSKEGLRRGLRAPVATDAIYAF